MIFPFVRSIGITPLLMGVERPLNHGFLAMRQRHSLSNSDLLFVHHSFLSALGGRPPCSLNWNLEHVIKMRLEEEYRLLTITKAIASYQVLRLFVGAELIFREIATAAT